MTIDVEHVWVDENAAALAGAVAAEAVEQARREEAAVRRVRRRRRTGVIAGGAALMLVGSVGAAAALGWSARTGVFGEPGMTENDTSEWLFSGAQDFEEVVRSLVPADLPLPPGVSAEELVEQQAAQGREAPAMVQETGIRGTAVFFAMCEWQWFWLHADERQDRVAAHQAVDMLRRLPDRTELEAVDGGGVADRHRQLAASAARGERDVLEQEVAMNCAGWVG